MIDTALVELLERVTAECADQQRPDLHQRLRQVRERVVDPALLVLVVGVPKQGKSELINAVVNAPVCDTADDRTTMAPSLVRHAEEPNALLLEGEPSGAAAVERTPVPIEQVGSEIRRAVTAGRPVARGEIGIPRAVLKDGLALMDTPPIGGLSSRRSESSWNAAVEADAVLVVSDATQELTGPELDLLRQLTERCPNLALVQPKTDVAAHWRDVVAANRRHLANIGLAAKIFPVSSAVRTLATRDSDADLNAESGFPSLLEHLRNDLVGNHDLLVRRLAAHNLTGVLDEIVTALRTELSEQNPRTAAETLLELETAQRRSEDLRRASTRWQKVLSDGIQELTADVEFDVRERGWAVLHHVNEAFERSDPNACWEDFLSWLDTSLSDAVTATFEWMEQRTRALAEQVAEHVPRGREYDFPSLEHLRPPESLTAIPAPSAPSNGGYGRFDQIVTGLRGSYGGVLMFGLITSMAGLKMMNVVSITAGLVLGNKSLKEEKDNRLQRRQAEARSAVQRYVDQVIFHVNKHGRDAIRQTHRQLRDHFTDLTEEAQAAVSGEIQEVKRTAEHSALAREDRAREIRRKLDELGTLRQRAQTLTANRIAAAK